MSEISNFIAVFTVYFRDVNYQGEEMEVGFNVTYILDVLNALKCQQVRIRLTDASSSCLIENSEDASAEYVIMPMRL